ncbi:MAG: Zn-dependent hydrolase [Pseudomonadota bacterium]
MTSTSAPSLRPRVARLAGAALAALAVFTAPSMSVAESMSIDQRLAMYTPFTLTADLADLSDRQKAVIDRLIRAAAIMDGLFWRQACCEREPFLKSIDDEKARAFARINYGPWDRLNGLEPFLDGVGEKPAGARFYPADLTEEEFANAALPGKDGLYSLVRRGEDGALSLVPYHVAYRAELTEAAGLLREAAALAEDPAFANYLRLRADAFLTSDYQPSDLAWMDMKSNRIDVVIGPIETYEDQRYGYRAAFEGYVLLKDMAWSARLARYAKFLPALQDGLPVPAAYRAETPGSDAELNAYDVIYYAGDCNAGSKTIAINLPNDEQVQLAKGTRRLQLKNAMRAKFDKILLPISELLIAEDQRQHITFDAFFGNTMFHEVAHGLGIKNTLDGKGTVRSALLETASAIEEGKADILGLYMITRLHAMNELPDSHLMDNYVTFLAGIFRSVRFGASSAHGRANMIRFNFFEQAGAFTRDEETGAYRVDFDRMQLAMTELSRRLLMLQGDGDVEGTRKLLNDFGVIKPQLQADLDRLSTAGIAVDIIFEQGREVLGLQDLKLPSAPAISSGDAH